MNTPKIVVLLSFAAALVSSLSAVDARPNILWIFTDDHSYQTIGAYGGRLKDITPTPNLDRLAAEGMRFDRCYVENSICAPSRAALLTGKLSHKHGKIDNKVPFNHDQQQFQKVLQTVGYQTAMVGKIHLNGKMQGFDYWEVLKGQGQYENPTFFSDEGAKSYEGYTTDIITDQALKWLDGKRDTSKPFMLMVHHKAPHRAWIPKREHIDMFEDVTIPEPDTLFDDYSTRGVAAHEQDLSIDKSMNLHRDLKLNWELFATGKNPSEHHRRIQKSLDDRFDKRREEFKRLNPQGKDLVRHKYQTYLKDYLRCIHSVDENIGRLLDYLEESGLAENTIVMYASDQGFYMGEHGWFDKRFMYEESFRTPFIVKWPGTVKAGSVNKDLVQNIDFAETFLDIAGAEIPADMQGRSVVPLLKGKTPKDWRESLYYHYYEYPGAHSVRRHEGVAGKRFKLIRFYGPDVPNGEEWELYDLKNDPSELNNLYENPEYTKRIKKMKAELDRLKVQYDVKDA
ncbi:sulfatase family protein [Pelagicoccus mobilis]|uniref:Sulfatase n=2 Tax=Pelagicoccus mobilis TaxID=415221 RepID=A0A934VSR8_9BACT|nr:sulfatase [Pelagicoccus mobilis]MBK1878948.1 sulfatase [Pelagicoccus mobilis]